MCFFPSNFIECYFSFQTMKPRAIFRYIRIPSTAFKCYTVAFHQLELSSLQSMAAEKPTQPGLSTTVNRQDGIPPPQETNHSRWTIYNPTSPLVLHHLLNIIRDEWASQKRQRDNVLELQWQAKLLQMLRPRYLYIRVCKWRSYDEAKIQETTIVWPEKTVTLSEQIVGADCLGKLSGQIVWADCLGRLSGQIVWADCLGRLSGQIVGADCLGRLSGQIVFFILLYPLFYFIFSKKGKLGPDLLKFLFPRYDILSCGNERRKGDKKNPVLVFQFRTFFQRAWRFVKLF